MPATPTITWVDSADGTGGVLTVTGSTAGTTNRLYRQTPGGTTWTSVGTRVGDGTIAAALTQGYYHFHVSSEVSATDLAISNLLLFSPVTASADSVHERIVDAFQTGIQTLATAGNLPGIASAQVYRTMNFNATVLGNWKFPCVAVTPNGVQTHAAPYPSPMARDDNGYPVGIFFLDRIDAVDRGKEDDFLLWRWRIDRYFANQRLSGVSIVDLVAPDDSQVFTLPEELAYQHLASPLSFRCFARELRGV